MLIHIDHRISYRSVYFIHVFCHIQYVHVCTYIVYIVYISKDYITYIWISDLITQKQAPVRSWKTWDIYDISSPLLQGADSSDMEVATWEPMTWTKIKTDQGYGRRIGFKHLLPRSLTARPWKWMVGRLFSFPFGMVTFEELAAMLNFRWVNGCWLMVIFNDTQNQH